MEPQLEKGENTSDSQERAEQSVETGKNVVVSLSAEEYQNLDSLGPDNEAVQKWLKAHDINENDHIVAHIDGQEPVVLDANPDDFLTRNRVATEAWHDERMAEAARSVIAIEDIIDHHTQEIAETGKEREPVHITEEEIRELGEEGLESAGVEEPNQAEDEARVEYERRSREALYTQRIDNIKDEAADDLARKKSVFDEAGMMLRSVKRSIIDDVEYTTEELMRVLNAEDYSDDALRSVVKSAIDDLQLDGRRAVSTKESIVSDMTSVSRSIEATMAQHISTAVRQDADYASTLKEGQLMPERTAESELQAAQSQLEGIDDFMNSLRAVDESISEVTQGLLGKTVARMEDIVRASYNERMNVAELKDIVRGIQQRLNQGDIQDALQKLVGEQETVSDKLRQAVQTLRT